MDFKSQTESWEYVQKSHNSYINQSQKWDMEKKNLLREAEVQEHIVHVKRL